VNILTRAAALVLLVAPCFGAGTVSFQKEEAKIQVVVGGSHFTTLHFSHDQDKPFLHPFRTASGVTVTRGWPVEPVAGETTDHPHQRGLWWAHGMTNGADFWTNGRNTGKYRLKSPPQTDASRGMLRLELDMVAPGDRVLGSLTEEYTFAAAGDTMIVDVLIRVSADRDTEIVLGDTKEGVMGFRVSDELTEPKGTVLMNSEGGVGENQIWGKRARWVDYSGKVGGQEVGVAMFDHPANPGFPTYWMARGYGLLAANSTGAHEFTGDANKNGSITIPRGGTVLFRHRVVIHKGDAKSAGVEALYQQFAAQ
jgi:hypothetical protein